MKRIWLVINMMNFIQIITLAGLISISRHKAIIAIGVMIFGLAAFLEGHLIGEVSTGRKETRK